MGKLQDHDIKCQQPEQTSETSFNQGKKKYTYMSTTWFLGEIMNILHFKEGNGWPFITWCPNCNINMWPPILITWYHKFIMAIDVYKPIDILSVLN